MEVLAEAIVSLFPEEKLVGTSNGCCQKVVVINVSLRILIGFVILRLFSMPALVGCVPPIRLKQLGLTCLLINVSLTLA